MKTYRLGPAKTLNGAPGRDLPPRVVESAPFNQRYPEHGRYLAACACHQWKMHEMHGSHRDGAAFARCGLCGTGIAYLRAGW